MSNDTLKVPTKHQRIVLWVHPEGRVVGSIFLRTPGPDQNTQEQPVNVFNRDEPFLVIRREEPDELRFYNKNSVVRVEYEDRTDGEDDDIKALHCQIQMMDGSLIDGTIREALPTDRSRLFDYLNQKQDRFVKIHVENSTIYLVNKAYIIHATDQVINP